MPVATALLLLALLSAPDQVFTQRWLAARDSGKQHSDLPTAALDRTAARAPKSAVRAARDRRHDQLAPRRSLLDYPFPGLHEIHVDGVEVGGAYPFSTSDTVVVASVESATAHLSADEGGIYSEFLCRVDEVLKGLADVSTNDKIVATRFGGAVRIDGTWMAWRYSDTLLPREGRRYLLFLTKHEQSADYEINSALDITDETVLPLERRSFSPALAARATASVLAEARRKASEQ
jgi:hypothetical protein